MLDKTSHITKKIFKNKLVSAVFICSDNVFGEGRLASHAARERGTVEDGRTALQQTREGGASFLHGLRPCDCHPSCCSGRVTDRTPRSAQ